MGNVVFLIQSMAPHVCVPPIAIVSHQAGLEKLNLGANLIGDAGVYELSYALLLQRSLKELALYANMYAYFRKEEGNTCRLVLFIHAIYSTFICVYVCV